ncbi:MAG: ArsC/Spx/MgsR family protein [Bacteroidota bacterium]
MSYIVYHNSRCKKSRAGLEYLRSITDDLETREYIKNGISEEELKEIILKTNIPPSELIRTQEDYYKKELKGKSFNDDEWIRIITENPKLLRRPVVLTRHKAVIGDPPENIDKLF